MRSPESAGEPFRGGVRPCRVDALLGTKRGSNIRQLSGAEIVERSPAPRSGAYGTAISCPLKHYRNDFPSLVGVEPPVVIEAKWLNPPRRRLGPYIPPPVPNIGLVRHIVPSSTAVHALDRRSEPDLDSMTTSSTRAWGNPQRTRVWTSFAPILAQTNVDIRRWWSETAGLGASARDAHLPGSTNAARGSCSTTPTGWSSTLPAHGTGAHWGWEPTVPSATARRRAQRPSRHLRVIARWRHECPPPEPRL